MVSVARMALAEAWGTFLLTLFGSGAIIALTYIDPAASSGFGTSGKLGFIGLAHGVALIAAIYSVGNISGAHINPAVTIAHFATKRIEKSKVVPYIIAQFAGATLASIVQLVLWAESFRTSAVAESTFLGNTLVSPDFGVGPALFAEVVGTMILVYTILAATERAAQQGMAGLAIGLVLAAVVWIFGPISGASLNPARTWGPTVISALATYGLGPLTNYWLYIIGPVLGGLLGGFLYEVTKPEAHTGATAPPDAEKTASRT